jgi:hypothetical protein
MIQDPISITKRAFLGRIVGAVRGVPKWLSESVGPMITKPKDKAVGDMFLIGSEARPALDKQIASAVHKAKSPKMPGRVEEVYQAVERGRKSGGAAGAMGAIRKGLSEAGETAAEKAWAFEAPVSESVLNKAMHGLAPAAAIGGGLGVAHGLISIPSIHRRRQSREAVLSSSGIPKEKKQLAGKYFEILDDYAPTIAENPTVSKAFVQNLLQYDSVDVTPKLVIELLSAQKAIRDVKPDAMKAVETAGKILTLG